MYTGTLFFGYADIVTLGEDLRKERDLQLYHQSKLNKSLHQGGLQE